MSPMEITRGFACYDQYSHSFGDGITGRSTGAKG
jgi:hypothetical protein